MPGRPPRAAEAGGFVCRTRQVAAEPVGVFHALLEGRRGFVEHVRELRPRNAAEEDQSRDRVQNEEDGRPPAATTLKPRPDEGERRVDNERKHEQVGAYDPERRVTLGGNIDPQEKPEPVAA